MSAVEELLAEAEVVPASALPSGPASAWLFFTTLADRDRALHALHGQWVTLDDRSVQLNYHHTWLDVSGHALHVAHAPAWPRVR